MTLYSARTAVVLAGHSKLGVGPFPCWAPLDRPYTLVVDEQADPATVAPGPMAGCCSRRSLPLQRGQPQLKRVNPVP